MAPHQQRSSIIQFLLIFLLIYVGSQLFFGFVFPSQPQQAPQPGVRLTLTSKKFTLGNHPMVRIQNVPVSQENHGVGGWLQSKACSLKSIFTGTAAAECADLAATSTGPAIILSDRCPKPPVDIFVVNHPGQPDESVTPVTSSDVVTVCDPVAPVTAGQTANVSLGPWKYSLFERTGTFAVSMPGTKPATGTGALSSFTSARFEIVEPGVFTKGFRTFITAPFLNFLIFIASHTPGYNLGIAIIILTLVVKILLFFPTQHALEGQKKMQMLQPKIEALKQKYGKDNAKIQEETMKLWKEHNINPFQSCLPMLIQFPVLIGLFYVIRDGSDLSLSHHVIYGFYQNLPWHFGTNFLGLDLLKPNVIIMPVLLVVLQFLQMKLTFSIQKRKKKQEVVDVAAKEKPKEKSPQDMQQTMMLYGLPLMIGVFAIQFPSAVALYWGISTLFAIGQQVIVNREHLRV